MYKALNYVNRTLLYLRWRLRTGESLSGTSEASDGVKGELSPTCEDEMGIKAFLKKMAVGAAGTSSEMLPMGG